jgi:hypothetical protein
MSRTGRDGRKRDPPCFFWQQAIGGVDLVERREFTAHVFTMSPRVTANVRHAWSPHPAAGWQAAAMACRTPCASRPTGGCLLHMRAASPEATACRRTSTCFLCSGRASDAARQLHHVAAPAPASCAAAVPAMLRDSCTSRIRMTTGGASATCEAVLWSFLHSHACVLLALHSRSCPPRIARDILLAAVLRRMGASASGVTVQQRQRPTRHERPAASRARRGPPMHR